MDSIHEYKNIISEEDIQKKGRKARENNRPVFQQCGEIVDYFEGLLIDECGLPYTPHEVSDMYGRLHVRVGGNGEEKHYVFFIDGLFVEGFSEGEEIWVDLSFDQFNDYNKSDGKIDVSYGARESIEKVQILPPESPRRSNRYTSIKKFLSS